MQDENCNCLQYPAYTTKLNMQHMLLCTLCILYGYSHLAQHSCRELPGHPWRLANETSELVCMKYMHKNIYKYTKLCKNYAKIMHNMQQICTICNKYEKYMQNTRMAKAAKPSWQHHMELDAVGCMFNPNLPLVTVIAWFLAKNM